VEAAETAESSTTIGPKPAFELDVSEEQLLEVYLAFRKEEGEAWRPWNR